MFYHHSSLVSPVLVGRAHELEILETFLHKAEQGSGHVVLLAGDAGVGKSRLVSEMRRRAAAKHFMLLAGYCFERDLTFPYAPLIDALHSFFAPQTAVAVQELLGLLGVELVKLLPGLALMLPELQPTPALEPEAEKRRLFETLLRFLTQLTQHPQPQPLLLVLEDLHWGDETSLDFLHLLARRIDGYPILVLATYRHEYVSPALKQLLAQLVHGRLAQQLMLQSLEYNELHAMLQAIFGLEQPVRSELLDALYELTEGNPFFIEEVLKALTSAGDIFYTEGRWARKPLEELHIPASLQVAVQRRTLLLSDQARELLTLAAVAGRRFDFLLLQEISGHNEGELLALIKELIRAQLVVEESGERFAFRHALTRQAIYDDLLGRERRLLHRKVAESIEHIHGAILDRSTNSAEAAQVADLSYHYYHANEWRKTLEYAQRAAERAQLLYAPRAAVEHFSRALQALQQLKTNALHQPEEELAIKLYRERGLTYDMLGEFEHARADLDAALEVARTGQDQLAECKLLLDLGFVWSSRNYTNSSGYLQDALRLARALDDRSLLAYSLNRVGNWYANIDQIEEALAYHLEALAIFQTLNDRRGLAQTLDLLGMATCLGSNLVQSVNYYRQAIPLFESLGDRQALAQALASLTGGGVRLRDFETVVLDAEPAGGWLHYAEEGLQIAREIGWRSGEAYCLQIIVSNLLSLGEYVRGLEIAKQALTLSYEIGHSQWTSGAHSGLGAIYLDLLALPAAREHLEHALQLAKECGSSFLVRCATRSLVDLLLQSQELARAQELLNDAFNSALPMWAIGERALWHAAAELALAQGDAELTLQIAEQLLATSANMEDRDVSAIPHLAYLQGRALVKLQRWTEAEAALVAAQGTAQRLGGATLPMHVQISLGQLYQAQDCDEKAAHAFAGARQMIEAIAASLSASELRDNFMSKAMALLPQLDPPESPVRKPHPPTLLQTAKQSYGGLTRREREVARLIAQGASNRAIAETLILSERSVEGHVANILGKLDFAARTQIAAWAVESGLTKEQTS